MVKLSKKETKRWKGYDNNLRLCKRYLHGTVVIFVDKRKASKIIHWKNSIGRMGHIQLICIVIFTTLWANSADDKLKIIMFLVFPRKNGISLNCLHLR